ncbi:unnamed protein product [Closterium sp. Yama58-4]|nr:unnamed protein product [Closterium sp. Yama58-4]
MAAVPAPSPGPTGARIAAQTFTFRELERATGGFSEKNFIGEGGFGRVYKGWLESTGQVVAVKQLDRNGVQGNREFLVEVLMLSLLHHPNLVNLIGYCADGDQRLLVYEFMPRGALEDHLHDLPEGRASLEWSKRMRVAAGAAKGLEYLHEEASPPVIYRDFKSSNILLDENWHPKLSDFGLAKLGPVGDKTHVSTRVMGTYGYCAPEYAMTGQLTVKSDVYSFGVVLLELITGRKAIDSSRPHGEHNLVAWARPLFKDRRKFPAMADPLLQGRYPMRGLYQALAVAAMCLQEQASQRPMIHDVVTALNYLSSQPYDPNNNPQPSTPGRYTPGTTPLHEKKGSRSPRRMAYFVNWAGMDPSVIPAASLTHVFYAFALVDATTYQVVPSNPAVDVTQGLYLRFNSALKTANPAIKTLLSIGGYSAGTATFTNAASSPSSRSAFIQSAIHFARSYNFDGLDIDWEYPTGQMALFSALLTDFRAAIESEAASSGKPKLLLTAAVSAYEPTVTQAYNVPTLNNTLDFVNIMTYYLHGSWEAKTGMHTALEDLSNPQLSLKGAMAAWVSRGLARSKAMLGLAMYGRTWTLASTSSTGVGAAATGPGLAGSVSREAGVLFYREISQMVATGGYKATLHTPSSSMYAVKGNQWVGYDNPSTITTKVNYAKAQSFGGWFFWALNQDANNALLSAALAV